MPADSPAVPGTPHDQPDWLALVLSQVKDLRYGVVQVVVHDGRVTQIERTERTRLVSDRAERSSR